MYGISWTSLAFDEMNRLLLLYPLRRQQFAAALREIDRILHLDPLGNGESRDGPTRVLVVAPLTVYYSIDFETDVVDVLSVSMYL